MKIDDETLIAYLDAELEDAQYDSVEAALEADPALRARLQALVESGERLRAAYAPIVTEAVPPQLIAAILAAPLPVTAAATARASERATTGAAASRGTAGGLGERLRAWLGAGQGAVAFASLFLLAMGGLISYLLMEPAIVPGQLASGTNRPAPEALAVALETAPSGRAVDYAGRRLELVASYTGEDARLCREYVLHHPAPRARTETGIACKEDERGWQVAFSASDAPPADAAHSYTTASDATHEALDDFVAGQGLSAMDDDTERRLIEKGWQR